jgi:hypothetical protein
MRVDLEANFSRSPRGFGDMPRSIQQESIEVAVQDAMLNRLLVERDGCRCTDSGFRIASRNSVEKWCLGNAGGVMLVCGPCTWGIFRRTFPCFHNHKLLDNAQQLSGILLKCELYDKN